MTVCTPEVHAAMKRDDRVWAGLTFVGVSEPGTPYALQLVNCPCGSTLARPLTEVTK